MTESPLSHQYQEAKSLTSSIFISIELTHAPIDFAVLRTLVPHLPSCGGLAAFEGIVRNVNDGESVTHLEYSAYEPLAKSEMAVIAQEAAERFKLKYVQIVHRTGTLVAGETAVIIQVLSSHRAEAFAGCQMIIDEIKTRVPIWKKEHYADRKAQWVLCSHGSSQIPPGKPCHHLPF